jgi:hypothetical protein
LLHWNKYSNLAIFLFLFQFLVIETPRKSIFTFSISILFLWQNFARRKGLGMTHLLYSGENLAKMFLLNFQTIHINFGTNDEKRQKNKFQGVCANVNRFKFKVRS